MNNFTFLYNEIQKKIMFYDFNEQKRNTIFDALKSFNGLVSFFYTFFKDFKCF